MEDTLRHPAIQRLVNSVQAKDSRLSPGKRRKAQLLRKKSRRLAPRKRYDERFYSLGERTAAQLFSKTSGQRMVDEAALFPIQARPEFRQQVSFDKGQRRLSDVLVGCRMGEEDHAKAVQLPDA